MQQTPAAMIGCDPPFSLLMGATHANTLGRCVADTAHPLAA
jgi:hypothetical protein